MPTDSAASPDRHLTGQPAENGQRVPDNPAASRVTVPWSIRAAVSMGGPSVWLLPRFRAGRWFVQGGWLLWSFYAEARRVA